MPEPDTQAPNHALVFGASGLAGWGLVNQLLLNYPAPGSFAKITALVNRPLTVADSRWPLGEKPHPEFNLVTGVNLQSSDCGGIVDTLRSQGGDLESVTHVFYCAYKMDSDEKIEFDTNLSMMHNTLHVLDALAPNVRFVVLPSGTKAYGVTLPRDYFEPPFKESLGRMKGEAGQRLFYYALEDTLIDWCRDKRATWCGVRPDAIIGFAPNGASYNLPGFWAAYLSLYAAVEGRGSDVPFPGSVEGYNALYNDSSSEIIAKFCIWAALNPHKTGGEVFNIADSSQPSRLADHWQTLTAHFGLNGSGPVEDSETLSPQAYMDKHAEVLLRHGITPPKVFADSAVNMWAHLLERNRHMSLEKARRAGFLEEKRPAASWLETAQLYKEAGMSL